MPPAKTLLVVDDDDMVHDLVRAMLDQESWTIDNASNGVDALEKLRSRPYDMVLTDIMMPDLDGLGLLKLAREIRPEMKVVVMTALNALDHAIGTIRGQAYSYLEKPFSRAALIDTLSNALHTPVEADDVRVLSARAGWISLQLRCKLQTADRLAHFFREMVTGLGEQERDEVSTAFRELLMNAIEHGGRSDPNEWVKLTYIRTARSIIYYIQDPGEGFSFDSIPHAAVSNESATSFEHVKVRDQMGIRPGGFGILLTTRLADEVLYNATGNEVMLIKYLSP
ncbi:MAG: response regulator [Bryobacterales bacterium]|nr:response regulator [Bryobacterales bacterium]